MILAVVIFIGTVVISLFMLLAASMSDNPSAADSMGSSIIGTFVGGTIVAILVGASHWLPHIGW
jgi:hypothetical protein